VSFATKITLCVLSAFVAIASVAIYLFGFASKPLSVETLFWAAPLACPLAFAIYLKSKRLGTVVQAVLYALGALGAYYMLEADCLRGNCSTQNKLAIALNSMVAGIHMICMIVILGIMFTSIWMADRSQT
jgi:hypothetical protein